MSGIDAIRDSLASTSADYGDKTYTHVNRGQIKYLLAIADAARLVIEDIVQFNTATLYVHSDAVRGDSDPLNELDRRLLALQRALVARP